MRLIDKVAIVTGAASGFGAETARLFASEGAMVAVADLNRTGTHAVAAQIGSAALAFECDVTQRADVEALVAACVREFGVPDIVVNGAVSAHRGQSLLAFDERHFDELYEVNVKSLFHLVHAVVPLMRARRSGVILNIGSTIGGRSRPGLTWYSASQGAACVLARSLAVELGGDGIRVNVISPATGDTGLRGYFGGTHCTPEERARVVAGIPLGRLARPHDVAAAALWLASDEAGFITGVELPVDGGLSL